MSGSIISPICVFVDIEVNRMFAVFVYYRDSGLLFKALSNVSRITFNDCFFRIHVVGSPFRDDLFVHGSVFSVHCYMIDGTA